MRKLIPEASGIVKSRRYPGIFWVHNDSGNPPLLFAVRGDGRIVRQFRLAIPNIDWEDIAIDDQGHLYLGDIGNNTGLLPTPGDLSHRRARPDISRGPGPAAAAAAAVSYALPRRTGSTRRACSTTVADGDPGGQVSRWSRGRAVRRAARSPFAPGAGRSQPRSIGRLPGFTEPATGADLSADGTLLAVCSYAVTRVYRRDGRIAALASSWPRSGTSAADRGDRLGRARPDPGRRGGRGLYRLSEATWRAAARREPDAVASTSHDARSAKAK